MAECREVETAGPFSLRAGLHLDGIRFAIKRVPLASHIETRLVAMELFDLIVIAVVARRFVSEGECGELIFRRLYGDGCGLRHLGAGECWPVPAAGYSERFFRTHAANYPPSSEPHASWLRAAR